MRLLIIEDEVSIAQTLCESLGTNGFRPVIAPSVEAAWAVLWEQPFDLILLDVSLPEGEEAGYKLAQELREVSFRQPILFLTAREALPDRVRGSSSATTFSPSRLPSLKSSPDLKRSTVAARCARVR